MNVSISSKIWCGPLAAAAMVAAFSFAVAQPAAAQERHRARIGAALQKRLASKISESLHVLVSGPQSEMDRLARAYGVRVVKRLGMGAVLSGSAQQVNSVAGDANVAAVSPDEIVTGTMAVATQSTGANLLWR